jgi:hypothetical protein
MSSPRPSKSKSPSTVRPKAQPKANRLPVEHALQALQERINRLEEVNDKNAKAFSDGIQMLEAQQEVLRRVARDLTHGRVCLVNCGWVDVLSRAVPPFEGLDIDFNRYLTDFIAELAAAEKKAEDAKAPTDVPSPLIATPDVEETVTFGGGS